MAKYRMDIFKPAVSRVIPPLAVAASRISTLLTMLPQKLRPRICIAVMHLSGL